MTDISKVFLGGSRSIQTLPTIVCALLQVEMSRNNWFLVGDAEGADLAFQTYLHEWEYKSVQVYAMHNKLRNNVGGWPVSMVLPNFGAPAREFYTNKDKLMARDCTWGIMLYDGKSLGTRNNIERLRALGKKCYVIQREPDNVWRVSGDE